MLRQDQITAVVLAAGEGKRLMPLSGLVPKPLVSVDGEPLLLGNLRVLAAFGIARAVVVYGPATAMLPDFLDTVNIDNIEVTCAFQAEPRGTGDALRRGIEYAPDSDYYLLMVADTKYSQEHLAALWERFSKGDVDGAMLLKRLSPQELMQSSVVTLRENGIVSGVIPKPSIAELRNCGSDLADASLHIYSCKLAGQTAGVVAKTPPHITDLEDFVIHSMPFGRRLMAVAEIERAVREGSDRDISALVYGVQASDIPFVCKRIDSLSKEPIGAAKQARALALTSEMVRQADRADCHRLAINYARLANLLIIDDVLTEAAASLPEGKPPDALAKRVTVQIPARLAFSSSQGSDVSYIIEEKGAVALNCAIKVNGEFPGTVTVERIAESHIELIAQNLSACATIEDYCDIFGGVSQADALILLRAGLRFSGLINPKDAPTLNDWLAQYGCGIRIILRCSLPIGSGLGCSGALAAGLIRGLREFGGLETSPTELLARAYCCEHYYGRSGYQDIIGGTVGGVKLIQVDRFTGLFAPAVEVLEADGIAENLLLFYTGTARQKTPYLSAIAAKYFCRATDYMYAYENGKDLTYAMGRALQDGDWQRMGGLLDEYWGDREFFEEDATPDHARKFREDLAPLSYGSALCGSGHGGYMMVVPRPGERPAVEAYLADNGITGEHILDFEVSDEGLQVTVD